VPVLVDEDNEQMKLETPSQVAARIGVSARRVRSWTSSKKLFHYSFENRVLIPVEAVDDFLKRNAVKPTINRQFPTVDSEK
jgi:excisionase family DNA binding protein